jgi:hypothetical protein
MRRLAFSVPLVEFAEAHRGAERNVFACSPLIDSLRDRLAHTGQKAME